MLGLSNQKLEVGRAWQKISKLARRAGQLQCARIAILQAGIHGAPSNFLESAKQLWEEGHHHRALVELQMELTKRPNLSLPTRQSESSDVTEQGDPADVPHAKLLLLMANWVQKTGQKNTEEIIALYEQARKAAPSEKAYYLLGKFHDLLLAAARMDKHTCLGRHFGEAKFEHLDTKVLVNKRFSLFSLSLSRSQVNLSQCLEYLYQIIHSYGMSLKFGHKYIHHSLSRLLTLWLDFGKEVVNPSRAQSATVFANSLSLSLSLVFLPSRNQCSELCVLPSKRSTSSSANSQKAYPHISGSRVCLSSSRASPIGTRASQKF
jgi:hypothetical protein